MVGTYYGSPNPDSPPFVKVGQTVKAGETLGIIEAMKMFNPIEGRGLGHRCARSWSPPASRSSSTSPCS
jgi:biotin carboxyl carrier protein